MTHTCTTEDCPVCRRDSVVAVDIAARLRNGGRKGGQAAGIARRARRQRYLDGTMTTAEREAYQHVLDLAKRAGSKGGAKTSAKHRAEKRAALVEAGLIGK